MAALLAVLVTFAARAASDLPRDHSIFVGTDVTVMWKGKPYRVIGADRSAVRIMKDQVETVLPVSVARDLRLKRGVKLSNLSAGITNLHGTKGADRAQAAADAEARRNSAAMQAMMEDQRDSAIGNIGYVAGISDPGTDGASANIGAEATKQVIAPLREVENNLALAARTGNDMLPAESGSMGDLSVTGFVVSFEVSTTALLPECHAVIVATCTLPGSNGATFNRISLQPLGNLTPEARKVTCELRGFPPGAELQGYRVALYSGGQEVATNISSRRTDVTREEAVLFLTTDYLTKHATATLPPAPILMVPRLTFASWLGSTPLDQVIYARVDKDGKILRLSTNAAGTVRLPPELMTVVEQIAFVPALEKGKPVEGVAKFKLGDLVASNDTGS